MAVRSLDFDKSRTSNDEQGFLSTGFLMTIDLLISRVLVGNDKPINKKEIEFMKYQLNQYEKTNGPLTDAKIRTIVSLRYLGRMAPTDFTILCNTMKEIAI